MTNSTQSIFDWSKFGNEAHLQFCSGSFKRQQRKTILPDRDETPREGSMERTKAIDELYDAGWQALESDNPAAFMEWRRRVAEMLGPDHLYAQLFQNPEDKKDQLTSANTAGTDQGAAENKRVA
jgi:hypothetical protein